MTEPLTPGREAEIRESVEHYRRRRDDGQWITYGYDPATRQLLAEIDRLRAENEKLKQELSGSVPVRELIQAKKVAGERAEDAVRALRALPDPMHPEIPRWFADRLVAVQILLLQISGDGDPGNVEAVRARYDEKAGA